MTRTRTVSFIVRASLAGFVAAMAALAGAPTAHAAKHRILFFTKSSGYEHSVIKKTGAGPSFAEGVLDTLAKKNGWEIVASKDGAVITPSSLASFDVIVFQTTGDLTQTGTDMQPAIPSEGKAWLMEAVKKGKGFVGLHNASDTFHSPEPRRKNNDADRDPYIQLLGGEFLGHGEQQDGTVTVIDPKFPGFAAAKSGFTVKEEWYSLKNLAPDMHVLLSLDTTGMKGSEYQRPKYPVAWARPYGKGRVFYCALGHREDVWTNPVFQSIVEGGLKWAAGDVKADVAPNLKSAAPQADVMPPPSPPKPAAPAPAAAPAK